MSSYSPIQSDEIHPQSDPSSSIWQMSPPDPLRNIANTWRSAFFAFSKMPGETDSRGPATLSTTCFFSKRTVLSNESIHSRICTSASSALRSTVLHGLPRLAAYSAVYAVPPDSGSCRRESTSRRRCPRLRGYARGNRRRIPARHKSSPEQRRPRQGAPSEPIRQKECSTTSQRQVRRGPHRSARR